MNAIPPDRASLQQPADHTARMLVMLSRMAELGMQLAERAAADALQEPVADAPKPRRPDPTLLFIRLSAMVRACINQHVRLSAGQLPTQPRKINEDPRRHLISTVLHDAIEGSSKPKAVRAEIHAAVPPIIDEYLASDPEMLHAGAQIAIEICRQFDIPYKDNLAAQLQTHPAPTAPSHG